MNDTIDRQAAIDAVMECYDNDELFEVYEDKLRELPPVQPEIVTCDRCVATKRSECIWHNAGATYCSFGEVTE